MFDLNGNNETIAGLNSVAGAGTGNVTNTGVAKTLTLGGNGTYTYSGTISPATANLIAVTKSGNGTQTLSGTNTYTGITTVSAGTLLINGDQHTATGAVTVASGATLGGTGTLGGATTINGILSPGSGGIGTLNIAANVTWAGAASAGSTTDWVFDLGASSAADQLAITGNFNNHTRHGFPFQLWREHASRNIHVGHLDGNHGIQPWRFLLHEPRRGRHRIIQLQRQQPPVHRRRPRARDLGALGFQPDNRDGPPPPQELPLIFFGEILMSSRHGGGKGGMRIKQIKATDGSVPSLPSGGWAVSRKRP